MERRRALVLHDDDDVRAVAARIVSDAGFACETAETSLAALRTEDARRPDLVVLSVTALADGAEPVALMRTRWPDATLLALFPQNLRERALAALSCGADGVLSEPFYGAELAAIAQRVHARGDGARRGRADAGLGRPTPVEQLAAGVAHTIRNPLQVMELMLASAESGDDLDLTLLREQTARMAGVADDLTRFGATQRHDPVALDLHDLIRTVFRADSAPGAARIELALDAVPSIVLGERDSLSDALRLVRDRAVRVTPRGGRVIVVTSSWGDELELRVTDGGAPPAADELAHFFEPDTDTDAVREGIWLETAALAGIVRQHGGTCSVAVPDENATTVVVRLPSRDGGA